MVGSVVGRPKARRVPLPIEALAQPVDLIGQLSFPRPCPFDDRCGRPGYERLIGQARAGGGQPLLGFGKLALQPGTVGDRTVDRVIQVLEDQGVIFVNDGRSVGVTLETPQPRSP